METELRKYVKERELYDPNYIKREVSENAFQGIRLTGLNELVADSFVKILNGTLVDKELERLVKGVLGL